MEDKTYPNLTGIHVHVNKTPGQESYSEHVLMIQFLSAVLWKQNNGSIHLYTTLEDAKFFEKLGLTKFYDKVDTEAVKDSEIDWSQFYHAAKMKVLSTLTDFPVAFVDTDFMCKMKVPENYRDFDILYAHREGRFWRNYPPLHFLGTREGYQFPQIPELDTTKPINVGFFIMNNPQLAKEYTELALDYMRGNTAPCKEVKWAKEGLRNFWKSLFVEQRLLGAVVDRGNYKTQQFYPFDYYGDTLTWGNESEKISQGQINLEYPPPFYHLWGEKASYAEALGQKARILNFYALINQFRNIDILEVQDFFESLLVYTAEKTSREEGRDVYKLSNFIKMIYNEN